MNTLLARTRHTAIIAGRELRSSFNSPVAYVVIVVFLAIIGYFHSSNLFLLNVASMRMTFEFAPLAFLFIIPAITMRLIAEEMKSGTIELLTTKPLRDAEVVLGKFLAAWALIGLALVPTLIYAATIRSLGNVDLGPVLGGYLGLVLMAAVYISLGLFASSITDNQIIAFILGFLFCFVFFMLDKVLMYLPGFLTGIVEFLGADFHYQNIARGVIDTRDLIYFASVTGFAIYLTVLSLQRRTW